MTEKKKTCGCGCDILPGKTGQKPAKNKKEAKKTK